MIVNIEHAKIFLREEDWQSIVKKPNGKGFLEVIRHKEGKDYEGLLYEIVTLKSFKIPYTIHS